jgi:hypothetical protein
MGFRSLSIVALFACGVGACALVDPVDSRYDTVSRSLAKARNEGIFLNLVRASHDYPLAFTTIANVTPTMTNTSSFALPSFTAGPGVIVRAGNTIVNSFPSGTQGRDFVFGNTTASNSTAVSTNFNVATQETSAFYIGFLKPIDLQILDYFIRQGYPRELLFWLFADSIQLRAGPHIIGMRYDPPNDYGCDQNDPKRLCMRDYLVIAIAAGLTVEELTLQPSSSGGAKSGGGGGKSESGGGGGSGGAAGGKSPTEIYARFCFDPVLGRQAQSQMGEQWQLIKRSFDVSLAGPKCGSHWDPVTESQKLQSDTLNFNVGPYQFKVVPRSAYGVFEFLGGVMKVQRLQNSGARIAYIPPGREEIGQPPLLATVAEDQNLITVLQNGGSDCFAHTWFNDGDYCVPESATTTKRIFSLLAQLIAIQTAASDLSITPVVRVIQ